MEGDWARWLIKAIDERPPTVISEYLLHHDSFRYIVNVSEAHSAFPGQEGQQTMNTPFTPRRPTSRATRLRLRLRTRRPPRRCTNSAGRPVASSATTSASTAAQTAASASAARIRPRLRPGLAAASDPASASDPAAPRRTPRRTAGGGRSRRGDVRAAILKLLTDRPMHGYEMIQEIAERSQRPVEAQPRLGLPDAATAGRRGPDRRDRSPRAARSSSS